MDRPQLGTSRPRPSPMRPSPGLHPSLSPSLRLALSVSAPARLGLGLAFTTPPRPSQKACRAHSCCLAAAARSQAAACSRLWTPGHSRAAAATAAAAHGGGAAAARRRCLRMGPAGAGSMGAAEGSDAERPMRPLNERLPTRLSPRLLLLCLMVLVFGVSNRVLYRIALVPMSGYVFFLAQFQNLVYLLVYFAILLIRFRAKLVTPEMLALPKGPMALIGGCEAASQLLFMIGASHLPGVLLPLVNQTYLVWNLTFASVLLGMRYTRAQIFGSLLVVVGVLTAVAPAKFFPWWKPAAAIAVSGGAHVAEAVDIKYVAVCTLCFAFPALASIIKERLFYSAWQRLGQHLDIFVVNSFASLFQALLVLLLLPFSLSYHHIALHDLPQYLQQGAACFQGLAPKCGAAACDGAPLIPILYVGTNLIFNISILTLIRTVGSVRTTILGSCLVPLTMLCFTLPLPYLDQASLQPSLILGAIILLLGLLIYNLGSLKTPPVVASADDLHQP